MPLPLSILVLFLPSPLKILFLRAAGHKVGENCHIGFSIINARTVCLGDNTFIGHFNLIWRLEELRLMEGSIIETLNWITGGGRGAFVLGENSAATMLHFFEASSGITIGSNTIIGGRGSIFYTHGITPVNLDDGRAIKIGDWCYIGAVARFVPGTGLADHSFVGMGSVVTKKFDDSYVLLAGCPARVRKNIPANASYFNRTHMSHSHHNGPHSQNGAKQHGGPKAGV